jgi:hypothetical protein
MENEDIQKLADEFTKIEDAVEYFKTYESYIFSGQKKKI